MNSRALVLMILSFLVTGCGGGYGGSVDDGPEPDTSTGAVTDMGTLAQNALINSRDGGGSFFFGGRSVWLFGDTLLGAPDADGAMLHSNSWSWTTDAELGDGILPFNEELDALGVPTAFFPLTAEEQAFNAAHRGVDNCEQTPCGARWALWPGQAIVDPVGDKALVFYHKIYAEPGLFNFHSVGSSVAVWTDTSSQPERPVLQPGAAYPTILFNETEPSFGDAALQVADTVYAYACELDVYVKPCRLGKVGVDEILNRDAWSFYAGNNIWSADVDSAIPLFNGADIMSISYNEFLQRYVAVYSEPLGTNVVMRTATSPEGPWTAARKLFEARAPMSGNDWIYDAVMHPEFESDNGRVIFVTYTRQTAAFQSELRLVSVELLTID